MSRLSVCFARRLEQIGLARVRVGVVRVAVVRVAVVRVGSVLVRARDVRARDVRVRDVRVPGFEVRPVLKPAPGSRAIRLEHLAGSCRWDRTRMLESILEDASVRDHG